MRFQVPQFIEVEDKMFGQLTIKQFIYLAGGAGIYVVIFLFLPKWISFVFILPIIVFSIALAFYKPYKVPQLPFVYLVEAAFKYATSHKLYIWKKKEVNTAEAMSQSFQASGKNKDGTDMTDAEAMSYAKIMVPKISDSKLKDLTWSLDIKESMYQGTEHKK